MTNWLSCEKCGIVNEVTEKMGSFREVYEVYSCACGYYWDTETKLVCRDC